MSIAGILLVIQGLNAAISAAPTIVAIVTKAKELVAALFTAGVITKEQQDALHMNIDARAALAAAGIIPPHWQVEPDPST